jgi:hypothetical protein
MCAHSNVPKLQLHDDTETFEIQIKLGSKSMTVARVAENYAEIAFEVLEAAGVGGDPDLIALCRHVRCNTLEGRPVKREALEFLDMFAH